MTTVPYIRFNQYADSSDVDDLLMFAAPARVIANWAGIPRKAWHIRMLFQRPISAARRVELSRFWEVASTNQKANGLILGPTAIVLAIQGEPQIVDGKLDLSYKPVVDLEGKPLDALPVLVEILYPRIRARLAPDQIGALEAYEADPFNNVSPEIEHDYVFEFALQMAQMRADAAKFSSVHAISHEELTSIVTSMESLCRPALVIDGQHRLLGAANVIDKEITLPVVAIPHCSWTDQIYQFVVINETAQKVDTSLLTDIFGSSLTKSEQVEVRSKLATSKADVESRIAAVVASRDQHSPFFNMVVLKVDGVTPETYKPFITEKTIRTLIDGAGRFSKGWRADDEFYEEYVKPSYSIREEWDSWSGGKWREYWVAFWSTVRDFYNSQAEKLSQKPLWESTKQSNLTKAVTLRILQTLFITKCIAHMREIDSTSEILKQMLGAEDANAKIAQLRSERAIPVDIEKFKEFVHDFFLERGVPLRVFQASWKSSLDDAQGQLELWETLENAWERTRKGERVVVRGGIFVARDPQESSEKDE